MLNKKYKKNFRTAKILLIQCRKNGNVYAFNRFAQCTVQLLLYFQIIDLAHILDNSFIVQTLFLWYILIFESTAYLKFTKLHSPSVLTDRPDLVIDLYQSNFYCFSLFFSVSFNSIVRMELLCFSSCIRRQACLATSTATAAKIMMVSVSEQQ